MVRFLPTSSEMIALLLILTWISQGIPAPPSQTGTVTGTLKTDAGTPAVGVRVGAMVRPESAADLSSASALSSIAETDAAGHFRLENVPQGRYYITAGRVDYPTFYPGTQDINAGRVVLVKPGDVITGIDFAMNSIAVRPPDSLISESAPRRFSYIPVSIKVEGGGPAPVFSACRICHTSTHANHRRAGDRNVNVDFQPGYGNPTRRYAAGVSNWH